jgi:hypothetical protein
MAFCIPATRYTNAFNCGFNRTGVGFVFYRRPHMSVIILWTMAHGFSVSYF